MGILVRRPCRDAKNLLVTKKDELNQCYEAALTRKSSIDGNITIEFTTNDAGAVESASRLAGNLPDTVLHNCILTRLKGLKFAGKATFTSKINFYLTRQ